MPPKDTRTLEQKIIDYSDRSGGPDACWMWTGALAGRGYGKLRDVGVRRLLYAHRVSWEVTNGPVPDGFCVLHQCDNPACVNPSHLWVGTKKDNTQDMVRKGRGVFNGPHRRKSREGL